MKPAVIHWHREIGAIDIGYCDFRPNNNLSHQHCHSPVLYASSLIFTHSCRLAINCGQKEQTVSILSAIFCLIQIWVFVVVLMSFIVFNCDVMYGLCHVLNHKLLES